MVEIQNLTKYYGSKAALKGISFTIKENEVLGFLGPNGAGKSTTLNIMAGVIPSTGGTVKIQGYDIAQQPVKAKKCIRLCFKGKLVDLAVDRSLREQVLAILIIAITGQINAYIIQRMNQAFLGTATCAWRWRYLPPRLPGKTMYQRHFCLTNR